MSTKFSYEVPLNHLDDFTDLQDMTFALSFLLKDERYQKYIRNKAPRPVILDNSANELIYPDDPLAMILNCKEYGCDFVVAPDQDDWTFNQALRAAAAVAQGVGIERVIVVCMSFQDYKDFRSEGFTRFAVPYEYRRDYNGINGTPKAFHTNFNMRHIHHLGCNTPGGVKFYRPKSCDTSMPIKIALQNLPYYEWALEGYPHIHTLDIVDTFFKATLSEKGILTARKNISLLRQEALW